MDRVMRGLGSGLGLVCVGVVLVLMLTRDVGGLAVSKVYHIQFCSGEIMDISCPQDWQIHITTSYYVYVHGINPDISNCREYHNSTVQCLRKIQFYDPDYYGLMLRSCQSKQRCDEGLVAKMGDPKVCWNYPRSPSDYIAFSYVCVNVHIEQATTPYIGSTTTKPRGSTTKRSGLTTSKPHGSTRSRTTTKSYPTTTWTRPFRTSPYPFMVATSRNVRFTSSRPQTTSYPGVSIFTSRAVSDPGVLIPIEPSKTQSTDHPERLMVIAIPIAVVFMIAAVVSIAAVIACKNPKKSSGLKRKLSQTSSVYYNNADRHSLGGDSVQTRSSIHGITNLGYDIPEKPPQDGAYVDHVSIAPYAVETKRDLDIPDIHINPSRKIQIISCAESSSDPDKPVTGNEPLAEQIYSEFNV